MGARKNNIDRNTDVFGLLYASDAYDKYLTITADYRIEIPRDCRFSGISFLFPVFASILFVFGNIINQSSESSQDRQGSVMDLPYTPPPTFWQPSPM